MKFSVIMTVYNGEKYISEALESVLEQTEKDFEIIVVNDGSTDRTAQILVQYLNNPVITIYNRENAGPGSARNFAMSVAKGDYFAFIDADDVYLPEHLSICREVLDSHPEVSLIYGNYYVSDAQLKHLKEVPSSPMSTNNLRAYLLFRSDIINYSFRRECYDAGYRFKEDIRHNEDYYLFLQLVKTYSFYYVSTPTYIYRRHGNNLTNDTATMHLRTKEIVSSYSQSELERIIAAADFTDAEKIRLKGKIYLRIDNFTSALSAFMECEQKYQEWQDAFYIGNILYIQKKYENALGYYIKALERTNSRAEVFNNLGCTYACMGGVENSDLKALQMFQKALKIFPEYMDARRNMLLLQNNEKENDNYCFTVFELRYISVN